MTYNKNRKIAMIKKICVYSICLVIISYITGCKFFNQPMLDYLEEWTNTAQVSKHTFDDTYPVIGDITNIPSGKDRVITYYLINPQSYTLDSSVTFAHDDSLVVNNKTSSDFATVEQDATDKNIIRLTLKNSVGATGILPLDGDGTEITPTITIREPNSGRFFGSYTVPVRVNSAPAGISSPIILCNTKDNTYVICFNMPDMNTTSSIHRDIVSLTVSGFYSNTYTVTAPSDSDTNGLTGVVNSYNDTNYREVNGSFVGNKTSRFVAIETGISLNTVSEPQCTITLTDSSGLTSAVTASTEAPPLPAVTASFGSGTLEPSVPVTFNQETANSTITLTLSSTEGVSVSGGSFTGDTATGSSGISLTFFKKGTYTVTATAGGISGSQDTTTTFTYTVPYSAVYISENGSNNGQGTPIDPFATLKKAIETIGDEGVVYVTGDVNVASEYSHSSGSLTLRGYGSSGGTLTNKSGRVLNITGGTVTLGDNITLTGTNTGGEGGAVYVGGGSFIMESGSTIANSTVQGTNAFGGGVAVKYGGAFTMNNGAEIIGCKADTGGGGVYVYASNFTMNGGVIGGRAPNVAKWGGGVYIGSDCEVTMSGNSEISYNSAEETGSSATGIHGGGVFFSAIGESTFTMNDNAKITQNTSKGSGGGVHVGNPKSLFFMNDNAQIKFNRAASSGTYNGGGGVYFTGDGTFTVSGSPDITDNTLVDSSTNNVTLTSGKIISIGAGGLTDAARIGVNTADTPGATGIRVTDKPVDNTGTIFSSDKGYYVDNKADGVWLRDIEVTYRVGSGAETEATFAEALPKLNGDSSGGTITLLKDISLAQPAEITGGDKAGINSDTGEGGSPVTIDLNGHTLSGNGSDSVLSVSTGFLEIKDSSSGGTGKITGGGGSSGGGIDVKTEGVLRLVSGAITGNTVEYDGGGVSVRDKGTFIMTGGSISDNRAAGNGGGVNIDLGCTFTMTGGSISSNGRHAGTGETIKGGGVFISDSGTFTMTGGSITDNLVNYDTGAGGGVFVSSTASFYLGGSPTITGNARNESYPQRLDNVFLDSGAVITIRPDLDRTRNGSIGVHVSNMDSPIIITKNWNSNDPNDFKPLFGDSCGAWSIPGYQNKIELKDSELQVTRSDVYP